MRDKTLLIMAPSSLEVDNLKYNEVRSVIYISTPNYPGSEKVNRINGSVPLHVEILEGNDFKVVDNDTTSVAIASTSTTGKVSGKISVTPYDKIIGLNKTGGYTLRTLETFFSDKIPEVLSDMGGLLNFTLLPEYRDGGGDISSLKNLTQLQSMSISYSNVGGDISSLKNLTQLQSMNISHSYVGGDISSLKNLTQLQSMDISHSNVGGDIGSLYSVMKLYVDKMVNLSWSSSTVRSGKTNIPLFTAKDSVMDLGGDVDNCLIDEAKCTNISGNTFYKVGDTKYISVKGTRTSASDSAIATLKAAGITVIVNDTTM